MHSKFFLGGFLSKIKNKKGAPEAEYSPVFACQYPDHRNLNFINFHVLECSREIILLTIFRLLTRTHDLFLFFQKSNVRIIYGVIESMSSDQSCQCREKPS